MTLSLRSLAHVRNPPKHWSCSLKKPAELLKASVKLKLKFAVRSISFLTKTGVLLELPLTTNTSHHSDPPAHMLRTRFIAFLFYCSRSWKKDFEMGKQWSGLKAAGIFFMLIWFSVHKAFWSNRNVFIQVTRNAKWSRFITFLCQNLSSLFLFFENMGVLASVVLMIFNTWDFFSHCFGSQQLWITPCHHFANGETKTNTCKSKLV